MRKKLDLQYYLEHPETKVVTRDGHNARIICTDFINPDYPVVALISRDNQTEFVECFTIRGELHVEDNDDSDLFIDLPDPVKKKVALNYDDLVERVKAGKTMWISVGNDPVEMYQITSFDDEGVSLDQFGRELEDLLIFNYHFADGDPCWKEVEE